MHSKPADSARLLTKQELAVFLGLKLRGVETLTARGKIPVLRITHQCVRYDLAKVKAALARYEVPVRTGLHLA